MSAINVGDRVQVIKTKPGEEQFLNKIGRVVLVTDEVNCVVSFGGNAGGSFHVSQLKKVAN
jgi:hypothetical protein